jgi:hypothetical protein
MVVCHLGFVMDQNVQSDKCYCVFHIDLNQYLLKDIWDKWVFHLWL